MLEIKMVRVEGADAEIALPRYETAEAAGADLRANFLISDRDAGLVLAPGARAIVPTGLRVALPQGFEMQIRPRSGLAAKFGVTVLNAPGTIDSDYRGEIGVILVNLSAEDYHVTHGERIAQAVISPVVQANFYHSTTLSSTDRGAAGFGSTGTK